jgi:hypothetical protein
MSGTVGACAVCGDRETVATIELPPRALQLMRHGQGIAWREVSAPATVRFCEPDWEFVVDLVVDQETNPLAQCNAKYAGYEVDDSSDIDESPEADHFDLETTMWADSQAVLSGQADENPSVRARVAARLVTWSLETLVETSR